MLRSFAVVFISALVFGDVEPQEKLHVQVLYESLCPDSIRFITQQLYPAWKDLAPYVNINLVPFGKSASLDGGAEFLCQHGPKECRGNKIMSCALHAIPDQNQQVEFVNCFMKTFRARRDDGETCASLIGLNYDHIAQCSATSLGNRLQLAAEESTIKFEPKFVPTIIYNGQFNQVYQDASLEDFRKVVCSLISQANPQACQYASVVQL